ncbi:MAG TPA: TRAP transporter large permease [Candidatus Ornithospirochaeta stercorigallinarum]|nr:TRAP transporter large permease [Candidatus Ornithospirochaeta stercorigallinarum]
MDANSIAILILLGSFFAMILLRFPIAYAVALSSIFCMLFQGNNLNEVARLMVKGISSFSLMAVPFFITMGVLMGKGGISQKLIDLANACVGWMRGGLSMVNIVASYFFGGISGSASADTASLGSILIPMMVSEGYDADFSTAVTITSSCEGLLVPPSHNMVIYATTAGGISVGSLFLAGYLPGALLALSLMIGSYIIAVKRNYPKGDRFSITNFFKQLGKSIWALAAVIIVVIGVVAGVFTATESAAIAVIYSLIVSVFVYKGLNWKGVWKALDECISTLAIVLILIATSSVFGYCLTTLHVPDLAAAAITSLTDNRIILILLLNVILLILGCIMDMAPIILIATPILFPIATGVCGLDPIQFGIMVVLNCGIGLLTPPVGSVLFIGSAVAKLSMEKVVKATLPFYLCMIIVLLLISFIPEITLILPEVIGGYVSPVAA